MVLATASPLNAYELPVTGSGELAKEFQDTLDPIPLDDVLDITRVYAARDVQFGTVVRLIGSNDAKQLLEFVEDVPESKEVLRYVQSHGLDVYYMVNKMNEALDLGPFVPLTVSNRVITGGVQGYMRDVATVIPVEDTKELFQSKLKTPGPISDFVNFILQYRFVELYDAVLNNEHYLALEDSADELGDDRTYFQTFLPLLISIKHHSPLWLVKFVVRIAMVCLVVD